MLSECFLCTQMKKYNVLFYTELYSVFHGTAESKPTPFHRSNKLFYSLYNMMSGQTCSATKVTYLWFNDPTALISVTTRQAESVALAKSQLESSVILNVKEFPFFPV